MSKVQVFIAAILAFSACAEQPSSIAPVPIGDVYSNISCSKARQLYQQEVARVPALISAQKQAVAGDAVGVLLIGVPVSSLSGDDLEGEIAATKGKLIALSARLEVCGTPPPRIAWG